MRKKYLFLLLFIIVFSFVILIFSPYDEYLVNTRARFLTFSPAHLLGTDALGRDFLIRLASGTLLSFSIAGLSASICLILSLSLGFMAYSSRYFELIAFRFLDGIKAIPGFVLAIFFMAIRGGGIFNSIIIMVIVNLSPFSYLVFQSAKAIEMESFVEAKYSMGASRIYILFRTILPHIREEILSQFTFTLSSSVIMEASLSYLGVGIPLPIASLGNLIMEGKDYFLIHPDKLFIPAFVLFIICFSSFRLFESKYCSKAVFKEKSHHFLLKDGLAR